MTQNHPANQNFTHQCIIKVQHCSVSNRITTRSSGAVAGADYIAANWVFVVITVLPGTPDDRESMAVKVNRGAKIIS